MNMHVDGEKKVVLRCPLGLRRLRALTLLVPDMLGHESSINADFVQLSTLTRLDINFIYHTSGFTLEDPEGWLDRPPAALLPHLEEATFLVFSLPPPSLARLLPALHHVTRLELVWNRAVEVIAAHLGALSRLLDLSLADNIGGLQPSLGCYVSLPYPPALQRLSLSLFGHRDDGIYDENDMPIVTVSPLFLTRLTALTNLAITHLGLDLRFEAAGPDPSPALRLRELHLDGTSYHSCRTLAPLLRCCEGLEHMYNINSDVRGGSWDAWGREEVAALLAEAAAWPPDSDPEEDSEVPS
jgi:hypothetical protein